MTNDRSTLPENALLYEILDGGVAQITLNRPEIRNAFDNHLIQNLTDAFNNAELDPSVAVILLTSTGRHFSAGADLKWMRSMVNASYDENLLDAQRLEHLMSTINHCSKPVVAKVRGAAFGGGIGLMACSDIVLAEAGSSYALSEVKLGLTPATIAPFVIDAIGARAARRLFLTGEVFDATKALNLGLVHEVVPSDTLNQVTSDVISKLLKNGPLALTKTKELVKTVQTHARDKRLTDYTCELIAELRVSEEGQEGLAAFLEKRQPIWPTRKTKKPPTTKAD